MDITSPFKKDIDKALRDLDYLHRLYNVYFQGAEEDPPRNERKALEELIAKIKSQLAKSSNASEKFQANTLINRYQAMTSKWDKHLKGIETGAIVRPRGKD